jgi:hypothetical protein
MGYTHILISNWSIYIIVNDNSYEMSSTKSLYLHYLGVCTLLFIIAFATGCTGAVKTTPISPSVETTPSVISTTLIGLTPSPNATMNMCPIPILIFNNSQEITKLGRGSGMRIMGHNSLTGSESGTVPLRGVIYHEAGFTRIFNSTGKQILFVNDSESVSPVPAGYSVPVTYIIEFTSGEMYSQYEGNNVTGIYQEGDDTCVAAIIRTPGSFEAPPIPPH